MCQEEVSIKLSSSNAVRCVPVMDMKQTRVTPTSACAKRLVRTLRDARAVVEEAGRLWDSSTWLLRAGVVVGAWKLGEGVVAVGARALGAP